MSHVALDGLSSKPFDNEAGYMAEDDTDRADEYESEREAEIEDELERIDRDPDEADDGSSEVGSQSAPRRDDRGGAADDELEETSEEEENEEDEEDDQAETTD
ncbi:hypothetical protein [Natrialba taiwanensis]|uniref:Uncharacterized protein n=1 Tax=Natrialba taiwanensis DSM 12281 TaxID=1230458 RepID=M0AEP1_9EURY|nr:hypothetical protein C484_02404 [Natrialba taiwanensis DSM 12281]